MNGEGEIINLLQSFEWRTMNRSGKNRSRRHHAWSWCRMTSPTGAKFVILLCPSLQVYGKSLLIDRMTTVLEKHYTCEREHKIRHNLFCASCKHPQVRCENTSSAQPFHEYFMSITTLKYDHCRPNSPQLSNGGSWAPVVMSFHELLAIHTLRRRPVPHQ